MFTGLIQSFGKVISITNNAEGKLFKIQTDLAPQIKIDDSVATNGVCLTAVSVDDKSYTAQAVPVTLEKTTLGDLQVGNEVNLELSMRPMDRLGGHMVQGHVNGFGTVKAIKKLEKTWELSISFPSELRKYMVLEGSIAIDGISLTIAALSNNDLKLAIIPHTLEKTTLHAKNVGDRVNIEVDMVAKYVENFLLFSNMKKDSKFLDGLFKAKYED